MKQRTFPGPSQRLRVWRQKWYYLPDDDRSQLRLKYKDKEAYFAKFRLNEDEQEFMLEEGMVAFGRLEARLLRGIQFNHYECQARPIYTDLLQRTDVVFIALDFEGNACRKGVSELGLARLDMQHLEDGIKGTNIATACRSRRDYLFHDYMRIDVAQLPAAIVGRICDKQVVLVGHCISNELQTLKDLGIPIDSFPNVIGIIDTFRLASAEIGCSASLEGLLDALEIPNEPNTFHCGGNDAYYTMQALVALLVRREERAGDGTDHAVLQRLRELAWARAPTKREIRDQLDEEEGGERVEYGGVGDMFDDIGDAFRYRV